MAVMRLNAYPHSHGSEWLIGAPYDNGRYASDLQNHAGDPGAICLAPPRGAPPRRAALTRHVAAQAQRLGAIGAQDPIVILIHGFQYDPRAPFGGGGANPHEHLFHFEEPDPARERFNRRTPWPQRLGLHPENAGGGLAICFGWASDPAYRTGDWSDWLARIRWSESGVTNYYAEAYRDAAKAGQALAAVIAAVAEAYPQRPVDLVAHSLGARVALAALGALCDAQAPALAAVGKVFLLSGAVHCAHAGAVLRALEAAACATPEIYNVYMRSDAVLRFWGRRFAAFVDRGDDPTERGWRALATRALSGGRVIGLDGAPAMTRYPRWLDLPLDDARVVGWAAREREGRNFAPRWRARFDHWAPYTWPPFMDFYRDALRDRRRLGVEALGAALNAPAKTGARLMFAPPEAPEGLQTAPAEA